MNRSAAALAPRAVGWTMPRRSTLARLQQSLVFVVALSAMAWLVGWIGSKPAVAIVGAALILLAWAGVLALEFGFLWIVSKSDSAPRPTPLDLLRAWWGEARSGLTVFAWRQPFRWRAEPDHLPPSASIAEGAHPAPIGVVLVHGFVCNRGLWTPWLERLRAKGHAFVAVNLEPVFGSIDDYDDLIDRAVDAVRAATGRAPMLVCHSMGGLAVRGWLRREGADARVAHVVTIGTPHRGTWLGRFSHLTNGRQMRLQSEWIGGLAALATPERHARFTCWWSNCDNIVFPTTTATLPGADNRLVLGMAHVALAFHPDVMQETLALAGRLSLPSGSAVDRRGPQPTVPSTH